MKPIVILGMHRSGTSAVTRALGLLGAAMGPEESTGEYWENRPMRRVNEEIMATFGGAWECPPVLPEDWVDSPAVRAFLPRGREVLAQEFGDAAVMVWKDPRTCLTLPFWQQVLDEDPVIVFIHRHPFAVARSLLTRDSMGRGHAFAMWERYNIDGLLNSVGRPTVVVEYERLIEDPVASMTALTGTLARWGVDLPNDPATTEMELSPARRHHQAAASHSLDDPVATDSQRDLFGLLREVDGAFDRFSLPRAVPTPHPLSVELLDFAARARASRGEAGAARSELSRSLASRRLLLRRLVERTVVQAWEHRPGRRAAATASAGDPPAVPTKR